jgi:hypothetical protein
LMTSPTRKSSKKLPGLVLVIVLIAVFVKVIRSKHRRHFVNEQAAWHSQILEIHFQKTPRVNRMHQQTKPMTCLKKPMTCLNEPLSLWQRSVELAFISWPHNGIQCGYRCLRIMRSAQSP